MKKPTLDQIKASAEKPEFDNTSESLADTALCLWDAFLNSDEDFEKLTVNGSGEARQKVLELSVPAEFAWFAFDRHEFYEHAMFEIFGCFDFEYVPWFIENCCDSDFDLKTDFLEIVERHIVSSNWYKSEKVNNPQQ